VSLLDSLERRWGRWCIPGLLRVVALVQALMFILIKANPAVHPHLQLVPREVMHGDVWRVLSFVFLPPTSSLLWIIFAVMFLIFIGDILEGAWGSFRLNLYYFSCVLLLNAAAFLTGNGTGMEATLLYMSLFLAACVIAPDVEIMLFFVFPVKLRFLGWFNGALMVMMLWSSPLAWAAVLAVLVPFACFAGPSWLGRARQSAEVAGRRRRFQSLQLPDDEAFHTCASCGVTEKVDASAEFRIAADGREFCLKCLSRKS
jgi:membrane associated rhomboid family serine protease